MTDLRALLGDRHDQVMQAACGCNGTRLPHCYECSDSTWDHECPGPVPCTHRAAGAVLARVLPDLLADAWDECKHSEHTPACRLGDGNCTCPNPYRHPSRAPKD